MNQPIAFPQLEKPLVAARPFTRDRNRMRIVEGIEIFRRKDLPIWIQML
jgi:hypothetical protein